MSTVNGIVTPPWETIERYHPGFALAVEEGIRVRPNLRTVQGVFSGFALNQPVEASFDQQITGFSIFAGAAYTVDPINAFSGNLFEFLNKATQQKVTGVTCEVLVRGRDESDYYPVPNQTPLELLPTVLAGAAGVWSMDLPDNVRMRFTLIQTPSGDPPMTVWVVFAFLTLGAGGNDYLCLPREHARARLHEIRHRAKLRGEQLAAAPEHGGGAFAPR